jgi:arylsulfatase A-like enzyme
MANTDLPNLVFVFPDQMGASWLGCYGNAQVDTPAIDRFAAEGLVFSRAYSASPVCTPFRGTLFTGRYPCQTGIVENGLRIPPREVTLAERFNEGGYHTAYVGKWHLSGRPGGNRWVPPRERAGFQRFLGWESHHVDHWQGRIWGDDPDRPILMQGHETDALTELACSTLDGLKSPFCLFVAYQAPHPPCTPPRELLQEYEGKPLTYRPNVTDTSLWYRRPEWGCDYGLRTFVDRYRGEISHFDRAFGRLLERIEAMNLSESTIVVLTSDHGEMAGCQGLYGKGVMYEEATRIPFVVRCPGGIRGRTRALLSSVDFFPTLLDLCGLPPASTPEGISYGPLIRGEEQEARASVYMQYKGLGLRSDRHKLVADAGATELTALYDMDADPYEMTNLIGDPDHRLVARDLADALRAWLQDVRLRVGDPEEAARPSPHFCHH